MPPGISFLRPPAFCSSTSGSAARTRGLEVMVSVAVMPTPASLMPVAAQTPFLGSTLGQAVQRIAPSSSGIVTWDRTLLYVLFPFFGSSTIIFLTSKCPSSVRAIIVERSLDAAFPTRTVVQDMRFSSLFRWLSSCIIAHFQNRDNFFSEALSSAGKSAILLIRTIYGRSHMDENRTNPSEYEAAATRPRSLSWASIRSASSVGSRATRKRPSAASPGCRTTTRRGCFISPTAMIWA